MRSLAKFGLIFCLAPFASPVMAGNETPTARGRDPYQRAAPPKPAPQISDADIQAVANSYGMYDQYAAFQAEVRRLEDARESLKSDSGRFSRAGRIEFERSISQIDYFIINGSAQDAADLFRKAFNVFRTAYFNYKAYPLRVAKLGMDVKRNLITDRFAAQRIQDLTEQREQAIKDLGYYYGDYKVVVKHLKGIVETNEMPGRVEEVMLEGAMVARSAAPVKKEKTFADIAKDTAHYLMAPSNIAMAFADVVAMNNEDMPDDEMRRELAQLRHVLVNSQPDPDLIEESKEVFWSEPQAQVASVLRDYQNEQAAHKRMGRLNYRMISTLKGLVDSKLVPEKLRVFLHDFFDMAIDERTAEVMRPLIRIILNSKKTKMDLIDELFELNSITGKDDELLVGFARVPKSPPGYKTNIKDLWYDMKKQVAEKEAELKTAGHSENEFGRRLQRMNTAEAFAAKLPDLSLYHEPRSPMQKRQTCELALYASGVSAGIAYYTHFDKVNGIAMNLWDFALKVPQHVQGLHWPF